MAKNDRNEIEKRRLYDPLRSEIRMSCRNAALIIKYFSEKYGVSAAQLVYGLSVNEEYLKDTENWLNNLDTYKFYYNCHHSVNGFTHVDWIHVGESVYRNSISGFFKTILKLMPLRRVYSRIPFFNERMSKASKYTILKKSKEFIRYRFEIPEARIRSLYSIGCECNWHIGILSALPKIQNQSDSLSKVVHEICAMEIPHLLMWCYDLFVPQWEIGKDGLFLNGDLIAKWIRLQNGRDGSLSGRYEFAEMKHANATVVLKDVPIKGRMAFRRGEVYGAPYCVFSVKYQELSPLRKVFPRKIPTQLLEDQILVAERRFFEAEALRKREEEITEVLDNTYRELEETGTRLEYLDHLIDIQSIKPLVFDPGLLLTDVPGATKRYLQLTHHKDDDSILQPFYGWIDDEIAPKGTLQPGTGPWDKIFKFGDVTIKCEAHIINGHSGRPFLFVQLQEQPRTENFSVLKHFNLTQREIEVLEYLPLGYTNWQIAAAMGIQPVSVKKHLKNLAAKLHASGRTEILYQALKAKSNQLPFHAAKGNVTGMPSTCEDITGRRQAGEALRERGRTAGRDWNDFMTSPKSPHVGMCIIDRDLRYLRVNERLAEMNGLSVKENIGKTVREVVPDFADAAEHLANRVFYTGEGVFNVEFSGTTKSEPSIQRCWTEHWLPFKDNSGNLIGINVAVKEITERKRIEEGLRELSERLPVKWRIRHWP